MTPAIADGHAVTVHYRLTLDDGSIAEDSLGSDPLVYQHGFGNVGVGNVGVGNVGVGNVGVGNVGVGNVGVGHERGLTGKVASHQ